MVLLQEPTPALERAFQADQVNVRHEAARALAVGDERAEDWLLEEASKGTGERQRALLLAAALMGTPQSHALVERAARKGRKPDTQRAFALLLYGSLHPNACEDAEKDWERCASAFERSCLLAGLLSRPQRMLVAPLPELIRKRKEEGSLAFLRLAESLVNDGYPGVAKPADLAASLLLSVDPRRTVLALDSKEARGDFPGLWSSSRLQAPPRTIADLQRLALVGDRIGAVLSLYEIEVRDRQALFHHYAARAVGEWESRWLWGAAGDLGLDLPGPIEGQKLRTCHVLGVMRLYRQDRNRGLVAARAYLPAARKAFAAEATLDQRWPAALLLAVVGEPMDREVIMAAFTEADPVWTYRFAPLWKFAHRRLGSATLANHWLDVWSRDLDSGWQGYLDREGPRWVAYALAGGSLAAENHALLSQRHESLEIVSKDYALDHVVYRDVIGFLLDGSYRWQQ